MGSMQHRRPEKVETEIRKPSAQKKSAAMSRTKTHYRRFLYIANVSGGDGAEAPLLLLLPATPDAGGVSSPPTDL
jgi:hypothetical protein